MARGEKLLPELICVFRLAEMPKELRELVLAFKAASRPKDTKFEKLPATHSKRRDIHIKAKVEQMLVKLDGRIIRVVELQAPAQELETHLEQSHSQMRVAEAKHMILYDKVDQ